MFNHIYFNVYMPQKRKDGNLSYICFITINNFNDDK